MDKLSDLKRKTFIFHCLYTIWVSYSMLLLKVFIVYFLKGVLNDWQNRTDGGRDGGLYWTISQNVKFPGYDNGGVIA